MILKFNLQNEAVIKVKAQKKTCCAHFLKRNGIKAKYFALHIHFDNLTKKDIH